MEIRSSTCAYGLAFDRIAFFQLPLSGRAISDVASPAERLSLHLIVLPPFQCGARRASCDAPRSRCCPPRLRQALRKVEEAHRAKQIQMAADAAIRRAELLEQSNAKRAEAGPRRSSVARAGCFLL